MAGRGLRLWPGKRDCILIDFCTQQHNLCNAATLLHDAEVIGANDDEEKAKKEIMASLPVNLNQKLKVAIASFDPLGDAFTWSRGENQLYTLKGNSAQLLIRPIGEERYKVVIASKDGQEIAIAEGLNFEYSFAAGEDYARNNRSMFVVSDREAPWRNMPPSEKQLAYIRGHGFRAGLDKLTRGQAADLISSGALKRN
jgi:hypothetical protein